MKLTGEQISTITQSSYYHLKHYHDFGADNADYWIQQINQVYSSAQGYLASIISQQEAKEQARLSQIFQGECDINSLKLAGFSDASANSFYSAFQQGKSGGTIENQIEALNKLLKVQIISENQANGNGLVRAAQIISQAFSEGTSLTGEKFEDLDEYFTFISGLYSTNVQLLNYANASDEVLKQALMAAVRKLNSAIAYYKSDYSKKVTLTQQARTQVEALFTAMEEFITISGRKNWTRHKTDTRSFDSVQAVIQHSASGFLKQSGGRNYEKAAAKEIMTGLEQVFNSTKIVISDKETAVVGGKTDALKKQQKADISLTFSLTSTTTNLEQFNITFSVKKKESSGSIQIHHGGSLFAYANRFQMMGEGYGVDFDFLNEGNFQYVYVNELKEGGQEGGFLSAFRNMLQGVGFLFLGQEVGKMQGADFLFIQGQIYAFSTILKRIQLNRDAFTVNITGSKRNVLSEKANLLATKYANVDEYYSDAFIEDSIKIGQKAIYGTQFTINLKSSYYA